MNKKRKKVKKLSKKLEKKHDLPLHYLGEGNVMSNHPHDGNYYDEERWKGW